MISSTSLGNYTTLNIDDIQIKGLTSNDVLKIVRALEKSLGIDREAELANAYWDGYDNACNNYCSNCGEDL